MVRMRLAVIGEVLAVRRDRERQRSYFQLAFLIADRVVPGHVCIGRAPDLNVTNVRHVVHNAFAYIRNSAVHSNRAWHDVIAWCKPAGYIVIQRQWASIIYFRCALRRDGQRYQLRIGISYGCVFVRHPEFDGCTVPDKG